MDTEIVQLHKAGHRDEALRRFAEQYQSRLYALARRLLGNPDEARDVLQEIFIHVDKSLPNFKGESSLYTWAVRLATHVCFNYKRKFDRVNRHTPLDEALPQAVLMPTEHPRDNPDAMCRTQFRQYLVEHALEKLPAKQRAVVALCDLEGMTAPEAAKMLGVNTNAVKSRLHRARAALRRVIGKEFEALGVEVDGTHNFECTQQYLSTRA